MHVLQVVDVAQRVQLVTVSHVIFVQFAPEYPVIQVEQVAPE